MKETYSYKGFFQDLYRTQGAQLHFAPPDFVSAETCRRHQEKLRDKLKELLGWDRLEQIDRQRQPQPELHRLWERTEPDGILVRSLSIQTLPGVRMPFYVLFPKDWQDGERRPVMICLPAHGANKEVVAGIADTPQAAEKLKRTPLEAYGRSFTERGYIAVCPDPSGFGLRQEAPASEDISFLGRRPFDPLGSSCHVLSETAEAFGLSLAGLIAWDNRKLLDYLETVSWAETDRIGCAGFSGGGLSTMWIAALDARVRLAVISGYIHGYYDCMMDTHLCSCNYVPGLWNIADISDIASLIAPRPLFVENGLEDIESGPVGIQGPEEQVSRIRNVYKSLGADEKLVMSTPPGPHAWHASCYAFVDRYL